MNKCYLCNNAAEIAGQDVGRREVVRCHDCGYYEITAAAKGKVQSGDFPAKLQVKLASEVRKLNEAQKEVLVSFSNQALNVQEKPD